MALETLVLTHPNQISKLADTLVFPMEVGATRSLWSLILKYFKEVVQREKCDRIIPQKSICYLLGLSVESEWQARQANEKLLKTIAGEAAEGRSFG